MRILRSGILVSSSAIVLTAIVCTAAVQVQVPDSGFARQFQPMLTQRCAGCHGASTPQGGLNLARFTAESQLIKDPRILRKLSERIESGEMPPPGSPPLSTVQKQAALSWLKAAAGRAETYASSHPDPGPPTLRRLTRYEYDRTIHDLIGITFDSRVAVGMQDDSTGQTFNNVAAALSIPPALMEKYMAAADKVLERVIAQKDGRVPNIGDRGEAQKAHNALFFAKPEPDAREAARNILQRFVKAAYRHPITAVDIDPLLALFDLQMKRGESFEQSVRPALKAVLVSPYFLYRVERDKQGTAAGQSYPIDDYALANRLSYFLWSSPPDARLLELAEKKGLSDPAVLPAEIKRMLADPRATALTESFASQWLQLPKLVGARPSTDFFPTFTPSLREAMAGETTAFFDSIRTEDLSLFNLLDADYTYLNEELAKHYGINGVEGKKFRRVALNPENHRGGLLGMGSVLAMTSHTYRTSPTLRGKWVLDVIFGTPPPPPPPGVSAIADEQKKQSSGTTFREILAQHASQPACAGCHAKMDPLGFALENYDAVGRWRTEQGGKPVDTSAALPSGEKLNGSSQLKASILKRKEAFARNVTEQMMTYALGRELSGQDEIAVRRVVESMKQDNYRFSSLVTGIVMSVPFRYRRNAEENPASPPAVPPKIKTVSVRK